mmetsp:Transcript_30734/g.60095  ORF Transcript_30734/g.60095 Transcript_30734/m.60095 type:complete len:363 (+) Transcript_30734:3-1091(+)
MMALGRASVALLLVASSANALHNPSIGLSLARPHPTHPLQLRGGGYASNYLAAGDALISEKKVPSKVSDWTQKHVEIWLKACGLEDVRSNFRTHQIDGSALMGLNEDRILRMDINLVAKQIRVFDAVTHVQKVENMPLRQKIKVPGVLESFWRFFSCRFLMTSEGKSGSELKEELINANSNMALVSALLLGVTMSWAFGATNTCFCNKITGKDCFCSSGFDLDGEALWAFFSFSTIASVLFTSCTITAVVQILAVQECSDDHEITVFFDKLGQDEVLCGPLMIGGIFFTAMAMGVYMVFTEKLGIFYNQKSNWGYITAAICLVIATSQIPTWASIARKLYAAKLYAAWHPEHTGYTSGEILN